MRLISVYIGQIWAEMTIVIIQSLHRYDLYNAEICIRGHFVNNGSQINQTFPF